MRPLNVKQVAAITAQGAWRVDKNLYVQVGPTGTKAWLFRYTLNGRAHGMGLGPLDLVTLAEARDKAIVCRKQLLDGRDPLAMRRAQRMAAATTLTFRECAQRYFDAHAKGWRNDRHRQQWRTTLEAYAYPVVGDLPISAIDTGLVLRVIEPLWSTKTETASRLRGRLEMVLDWATARGYRAGENPARWRGHLDKLLPQRLKVAPVNHHDALSYVEVPAFLVELRKQVSASSRCLEFVILTAARSGEAIGARWSEIDLDAKTWTIPAERMKSGKVHVVPLSERAVDILTALPRSGNDVVFGGRGGRPINRTAMSELLHRMGRTFTVHGFRSTFRDWAAEQTSYPNHVVEMALAHAIGDKVEAAYRRGDLLAKRRELMQDWASYCDLAVA